MELLINTLKNGIRLVHLRTNGIVGHLGIMINTGSADEDEKEHGIAHLIEHLLFKGTSRRKAWHILSRLEDVGGELNAYTTKEETAIHASFLSEHYQRAMELMSDIVFRSVFPLKEIEKEKEVVIEEINSWRDNPAEHIFDDFEEIIFPGQPIGRNILGDPSTVKTITRKKIIEFIGRNYSTDKIVVCSAGNINEKKLLNYFEKYFSDYPERRSSPGKPARFNYKPVNVTRKMDTWQCHCILGNIAYSVRDERRTGLMILNNLLGGPGMNSRLNMSLRERHGLAYNVESNYTPYLETGVFSIYFGTDSQNLEKCIHLLYKELDRLRKDGLGSNQFHSTKKQIKGYIARGFENHESHMLSLGKSLLVYDRIDTLEEIYSRIDSLGIADLVSIASEVFERSEMSMLVYR